MSDEKAKSQRSSADLADNAFQKFATSVTERAMDFAMRDPERTVGIPAVADCLKYTFAAVLYQTGVGRKQPSELKPRVRVPAISSPTR